MASSSNQHPDPFLFYLYVSNSNVSNFVSVKLSGSINYHLWQAQMICLMKTHNMVGLVDDKVLGPCTASNQEMRTQYDSLLKGWIFGSISEGLLGTVIDLDTANEVWEKLKSFYDPTIISQPSAVSVLMVLVNPLPLTIDSTKIIVESKADTKDKDVVSSETITNDVHIDINMSTTATETEDKDEVSTENIAQTETVTGPVQKQKKDIREMEDGDKKEVVLVKTKTKYKDKNTRNKELCKAIVDGSLEEVYSILIEDKDATTESINSDGNTVLHVAVGVGRNLIVGEILSLIEDVKLPDLINLDGSTALHISAIVGNTVAAELLIKKNKSLLEISDHKGKTPLDKAYENMHLGTIEYLLKAANDVGKTNSPRPGVEIGVNLLVNAISAKQYDLATKLVKDFPEFVVENDNALMALARTFPSGLDYGETLFYPSSNGVVRERIVHASKEAYDDVKLVCSAIVRNIWNIIRCRGLIIVKIIILGVSFFILPIITLIWIIHVISFLAWMVYYPFSVLYFFLWNIAKIVVAPIKNIVKKKKEWEEAKKLLKLVCDEIDKLESPTDTHPRYYSRPVLEAARQNHFDVVDEILSRCPEAIRYKDKNGYDIIQLAVIHRSEKIYNLIYIIGERQSVYRTIEDSSKNNMLHLAGRLAPLHKLNRRTGAALQLQRELQWREEVKKLVFPTYITKENIFMETPDMVFTKEHTDLVKEGEKWMKTVAESCSITAALITTIVFAAAITVPGGSNQETGIPLFTNEVAFTIFAVSDAISLFTSSTALLMFLSILTARFAEQDFLVSLPRRLIIALCTLLLSATTMMVAFSATLFLVFCHKRPWMLAPICVLAFLPIASFGTLQIPLIVDLFRSTYLRIFGIKSNDNILRFNPIDIRLLFGK